MVVCGEWEFVVHWKVKRYTGNGRPEADDMPTGRGLYGGARMARRAHAHKRLLSAHFRLTDTCDHRECSAINGQSEGQMVNRTWSLHRTQTQVNILGIVGMCVFSDSSVRCRIFTPFIANDFRRMRNDKNGNVNNSFTIDT